MFLPIRSKNPPESLPIVTICLILLNSILYFATSESGLVIRKDVIQNWGLKGTNFDLPHMFSSMFLHGSPLHLIGNMWFLYLFGFAVEGRLRSLKFLLLYFVAGLTGDVMHQAITGHLSPNVPSIGASGAIMGVVGAAMWLFPHAKVTTVWGWAYRFGKTDLPLYGVALYFLGFDLLWAMIGVHDGVGHFAHLGGALGGLVVCVAFRPKRDNETVSEAKATLADTKDLRTLSRMELAQLHETNPSDTAVVLNWAHRSLREPGGIRPDCEGVFLSELPKLIRDHEVGPVASVLAFLAQDPKKVKPAVLLDVATRLERANDPGTANQFYDMVMKHPESSQDDLQAAAFRTGMLAEASFRDLRRAHAWYAYVVNTWPMGHLAPQAKARMEIVEKAASRTAV